MAFSTVPTQNYSQFALTLDECQQINGHFRSMADASSCIHMRCVVIPYMFRVRMMPKFLITKEKEKHEGTIKWPQQNV